MIENIRNSREIEYKWQAHSICDFHLFLELACNLGAKLSKPKKIKISDLYLDTREKFFMASNLECRIRFTNKDAELTLKSFASRIKKFFSAMKKAFNFLILIQKKRP